METSSADVAKAAGLEAAGLIAIKNFEGGSGLTWSIATAGCRHGAPALPA